MSTMTPATYEDYIFPKWADSLGWMMGLSTLVPFFIWAAIVVWKRNYVKLTILVFFCNFSLF